MLNRLLFVATAFLIACLLAFVGIEHPSQQISFSDKQSIRTKTNLVRCSPDWNSLKEWLEEADIPPIPGAGNYQWKISTRSDSAQFYFNQGINTYYSFHIIESMASFRKAIKFDPGAAMLYWGQALAFGPNINDYGYAASPEALNAVNKARELSVSATALEKALIDAMSVRYTTDSADLNRRILNERYTAEMKKVYEQFPDEADAATLYADAMMLEHPWDLWFPDGNPKPWTPAIRSLLEKTLARAPLNPGANHYYIHVMEPSPFADKALPSANRLGKLTPGLSHTVHMPSHIYLRTGNYTAGVNVNIEAVKKYRLSIPLYSDVQNNDFLYIIHNLHMQANNAMMGGRYALAEKSAADLLNNIKPDYMQLPGALGNLVQYISMTPTLLRVKFGKWDKLLADPKPAENLIYARLIWHFGRGMAYAGRSKFDQAYEELGIMQSLMRDSSLYIPYTPFSPAIDGAAIAENILIGTLLRNKGKMEEAVAAFELAVTTEENMTYDEPRDWLISPSPYLGNCLLKMGKPEEAIKAFEKDQHNNRENGWSLYGLMQCYAAQANKSEQAKLLARYKKAFSLADISLKAAVY